MKILFFLNHPAHFHLFKNTIYYLKNIGHDVSVLIRKKDVLEDLMVGSGINYSNVLPGGRGDGILGIIESLIRRNIGLYKHCQVNKPDLMVGTSAEIAHMGRLLKIPSINFSEDDVSVIRNSALLTYSFTTHILSPDICDNGKWSNKTISYNGYQKLAYLHPNYFTPDVNVLKKYIPDNKAYFIIRFAKLTAHHDKGIKGIDDAVANDLIGLLRQHGNVYISSERQLPETFEAYRLKIDPRDIHHVLAFAKILIGDSQSMSVEAAMLGTPSIRFSDFSGKISVLEELEHKYGLTYGILPDKPKEMFKTIKELLATPNLDKVFYSRRMNMLRDKIDVTAFLNWFIANYPESYLTMQDDPDHQKKFMNNRLHIEEIYRSPQSDGKGIK